MVFVLLCLVISLFIGGGCLFGLPVLNSKLRQQARGSAKVRWFLIISLSTFTFAVFMPLLAYIYAVMMTGSYQLDYIFWMFDYTGLVNHIRYVLWIHYLLPPAFLSNEVCFSSIDTVCSTTTSILNQQTRPTLVYQYMLILALMPAICCDSTVQYSHNGASRNQSNQHKRKNS